MKALTFRLGEICEIISGATPKTSIKEYWDGDVDWVTPADLSKLQSAYISRTERRISAAGLKSCATKILPPHSVLLSSRAPIGHVAINTVPMATNQGFKSLVPDKKRVDSKYLYYWLVANRARIQGLGNGATFKEVSKATVSNIEIPLPPRDEQRRIAAILDKADALRQKRKQAIALLDGLTQSIFLEMFGDPISNPKSYPVCALEQVVSSGRKITYGILKPGEHVEGGVPYVRVVDIQNNKVLTKQLRKTSIQIAAQYKRSSLKAGDLLFSIRGHVGRMAIAPTECDSANITQDTARLAIEHANTEFVMAQLSNSSAQKWMKQRTKGAAVRGINLSDLKKFPLILPSDAEQLVFSKRRRCTVSLLEVAHKQLEAAMRNFESLQHRAFSGDL